MINSFVYIMNKGEFDGHCGYITHYSLFIYDDSDSSIKVDEDNYVSCTEWEYPSNISPNIDSNKKYLICENNRYGFLQDNKTHFFDEFKSGYILQQLKEIAFERIIIL